MDILTWVVPVDPLFCPEESVFEEALEFIRNRDNQLEGCPMQIELERFEKTQYFTAGCNLDAAYCGHCQEPFSLDAWSDWMSREYEKGEGSFLLEAERMPCCGARLNLNELRYELEQGFATFGINIWNAGVVTQEEHAELERIFNTKMRIIYQGV